MKRILAAVLALTMMMGFAGCANTKKVDEETTTTTTKGGLQIEFGDVVLSDDEA